MTAAQPNKLGVQLYYPLSFALQKESLNASLWPQDKNNSEWKKNKSFHSHGFLSSGQRLAFRDNFLRAKLKG